MKSLDASAKSLDASAKYFGRVGEILGRVGEIFWIRRRRFGPLGGTRFDASGQGYHFGDTFCLTFRHITFVASLGSLFGEMCFHGVVYISLDSMACAI